MNGRLAVCLVTSRRAGAVTATQGARWLSRGRTVDGLEDFEVLDALALQVLRRFSLRRGNKRLIPPKVSIRPPAHILRHLLCYSMTAWTVRVTKSHVGKEVLVAVLRDR